MQPRRSARPCAWSRPGIACLKASDRGGYREASRRSCSPVAGPDCGLGRDACRVAPSSGRPGPGRLPRPDRLVRATAGRRSRATPHLSPLLLSSELGGLLIRAGRIDEAITRLNEGTAAAKEAKFQDYPTDWAYLSLAHWSRETLPKPAVGSTASARSVLLRRSPSGIFRSWPSSGARPSRCSSMPSFRGIPFRVGGRDEPTYRRASLAAAEKANPQATGRAGKYDTRISMPEVRCGTGPAGLKRRQRRVTSWLSTLRAASFPTGLIWPSPSTPDRSDRRCQGGRRPCSGRAARHRKPAQPGNGSKSNFWPRGWIPPDRSRASEGGNA